MSLHTLLMKDLVEAETSERYSESRKVGTWV